MYQTKLALKAISTKDWKSLIRHFGSRAAFVSRLLLNEVPDNIEKPFQALDLHFLPHSARDMTTSCSCPDYYNPCKHIAGLCYFLAALLDRDPFLLFELRGLEREELFRQLRATPLGKALALSQEQNALALSPAESFFTRPQALLPTEPADSRTFWEGKKRLPDLPENASAAHIPALLVKKGGDFPEFWDKNQSFPSAMEGVYEAIRKRAKEW